MQLKARILFAIAIAVSLIAIFTIFLVSRSFRIARQSTIHLAVDLAEDHQRGLVDLLVETFDNLRLVSSDGKPIKVFTFDAPRADNWDIIVETADTFSARSSVVAFDPYVLLSQTKAGIAPTVRTGSSIRELTSWLDTLDRDSWSPFVIAGDERRDFAALILYLAGELLRAEESQAIMEYVSDNVLDSDDESIDEQILNLAPVLDLLIGWRSLEIIPFNWTDWDTIAVENEILNGRAALAFVARSLTKAFDWQERLDLEVHRLPSGSSRREYGMIGEGVVMLRGDGVLSDLYDDAADFLAGGSFQDAIERETVWTPLSAPLSPINREHRDVVRWIEGAHAISTISPKIYLHPLFERLHILLR